MNDHRVLPIANLSGQRIGLSGAIPDPAEWAGRALDWEILNAVSTLTNTVCRGGGRLVHGSHPSFTPRILAQAAPYAEERGEPVVTFVLSGLFADDPLTRQLREQQAAGVCELIIVDPVYPPGHAGQGADDPAVRNASLTAMRERLIDGLDALFVIGGKRWAGSPIRPGILEEVDLAQARGIAVIPLGGLGGMAADLGAGADRQAPDRSRSLTDAGVAPSRSVGLRGLDAATPGAPALLSLSPTDDVFVRTTPDYGRAIGLVAEHLARRARP